MHYPHTHKHVTTERIEYKDDRIRWIDEDDIEKKLGKTFHTHAKGNMETNKENNNKKNTRQWSVPPESSERHS